MDRKPIQKVVRKVALKEQPTDFAYWQEQSYEARLAALEEIRREYHQWHYDTQPRLQRFLWFAKRA
jgi:hypothetical protein